VHAIAEKKRLDEIERMRNEARRWNIACGHANVEAARARGANETSDTQRIDFLERWVAHSRSRGFHWDTFTFKVDGPTVREQLDEQMKAGMVELEKRSPEEQKENLPTDEVMLDDARDILIKSNISTAADIRNRRI